MIGQVSDLDVALKQLKGLNNDPAKRANIVEYVKTKGTIAVFAYASLIWNPFEHVEQIIPNCVLTGYIKGFLCHDFIYRGTKECMGLTMGLKPCENSHVKGYLLKSGRNRLISFIQAFVKRETPADIDGTQMDIYTYDFLPVVMSDGETIEWALTCVVNDRSQFYLSHTLSIKEQAEIIGRSYGMNGTNFQYLHNTMHTYQRLALQDTSTLDMERLYDAVVDYRQRLVRDDRERLEKFDQLTTKDERELAIKLRNTDRVRIHLQQNDCPHPHIIE